MKKHINPNNSIEFMLAFGKHRTSLRDAAHFKRYTPMTNIWRFSAFIFGPGLLLSISSVGQAAINAFMLDNCDSKFGCSGGVEVIAFITGIMFVLSSASHALTSIGYKTILMRLSFFHLLCSIVILGAWQWVLFLTFDTWPIDSIFGKAFAWFCASFAISWIVLEIIQRWAYNNSFKRTATPKYE